MNPTVRSLSILTCSLAFSAPACALTSRSEPMRVRYFTLNDAVQTRRQSSENRELELRLGRVEAGGDLSDELAVRTGKNELTYREDQRWTEKPELSFRRGLERALFQERGLTRAYSGSVPTLDVELIELAEVEGQTPRARVRALAHLHDERRGLCDETFNVEQPIAAAKPERPEETVAALSSALHATVSKVADRVVQCLTRSPQEVGAFQRAPDDTQRAGQP